MSSAMILDPAPSSDATRISPIGLQDVDSRDNGGCNIGKQDIHDEAVEHPVLCKQNGVDPLTGVLLNGSQGTLKRVKTKPSKAIINRTRAAYRRVSDPAFFRKYLEETKKRISEGNASSETYMEELTAIATSNFDAQTRTDKVVERVFAAVWIQVSKQFRNVPSPSKGRRTFLEMLCVLPTTVADIETETDSVVERIFSEIWRQVQEKQAAGLHEATMVSEEEFRAEWEARLKLLDQRFEMLDESEKNVDWEAPMKLLKLDVSEKNVDCEAQMKLLKRRIEILNMDKMMKLLKRRVDLDKKMKLLKRQIEISDMDKKKKHPDIMQKTINSLIFDTSKFMASFENSIGTSY